MSSDHVKNWIENQSPSAAGLDSNVEARNAQNSRVPELPRVQQGVHNPFIQTRLASALERRDAILATAEDPLAADFGRYPPPALLREPIVSRIERNPQATAPVAIVNNPTSSSLQTPFRRIPFSGTIDSPSSILDEERQILHRQQHHHLAPGGPRLRANTSHISPATSSEESAQFGIDQASRRSNSDPIPQSGISPDSQPLDYELYHRYHQQRQLATLQTSQRPVIQQRSRAGTFQTPSARIPSRPRVNTRTSPFPVLLEEEEPESYQPTYLIHPLSASPQHIHNINYNMGNTSSRPVRNFEENTELDEFQTPRQRGPDHRRPSNRSNVFPTPTQVVSENEPQTGSLRTHKGRRAAHRTESNEANESLSSPLAINAQNIEYNTAQSPSEFTHNRVRTNNGPNVDQPSFMIRSDTITPVTIIHPSNQASGRPRQSSNRRTVLPAIRSLFSRRNTSQQSSSTRNQDSQEVPISYRPEGTIVSNNHAVRQVQGDDVFYGANSSNNLPRNRGISRGNHTTQYNSDSQEAHSQIPATAPTEVVIQQRYRVRQAPVTQTQAQRRLQAQPVSTISSFIFEDDNQSSRQSQPQAPVVQRQEPISTEIPVGYRTDISEFDAFRSLFAHSLPLDINPFAVILQWDIKHGIAFVQEDRLFVALGQNLAIRRVRKPDTASELLAILGRTTLSDAMSADPRDGIEVLRGNSSVEVELADEDEMPIFWDEIQGRHVGVFNAHRWVTWIGGDWREQGCGCESCVERGAGRASE